MTLNSKVTELFQVTEAKFQNREKSRVHYQVLMFSNDSKPVELQGSDRRCAMLSYGDRSYINDTTFFKALEAEWNDTHNFRAIYQYFREYDLEEFDCTKLPKSEEKLFAISQSNDMALDFLTLCGRELR